MMDNTVQVTINDSRIIDVEDCDAAAVVNSLRVVAETIERFGIRAAIKALAKSAELQEACFAEASTGDAFLSTIIG